MNKIKKVLIYENRKTDPYGWDISTSKLEREAYLSLFTLLDKKWQLFESLGVMQSQIYAKAKQGDCEAARSVLEYSRDWEYGGFTIIKLQERDGEANNE